MLMILSIERIVNISANYLTDETAWLDLEFSSVYGQIEHEAVAHTAGLSRLAPGI
jgi:hypothetical protein